MQAPSTFSTPTLGAALCLLLPDGSQSLDFDMRCGGGGSPAGGAGADAQTKESVPCKAAGQPAAGELALAPPMLGTSQRLLNRDHHTAYFEVCTPGKLWNYAMCVAVFTESTGYPAAGMSVLASPMLVT